MADFFVCNARPRERFLTLFSKIKKRRERNEKFQAHQNSKCLVNALAKPVIFAKHKVRQLSGSAIRSTVHTFPRKHRKFIKTVRFDEILRLIAKRTKNPMKIAGFVVLYLQKQYI